MYIIEQEIEKELQMLYKENKEIKEKLKKAPKGNLRISNSHSKREYYHIQEGEKKNGKYIKKKDMWLAIAIAQRDYDRELLVCIERRISLLEKFQERLNYKKPEEVYGTLNPYRRTLVTPHILTDEEYVKQWMEVEYQRKAFEEEESSFITEKGERVRSKSEKIIADKLYSMGIPYRYECPILLSNSIRIYPDFTMLKMPDRKVVYMEHFGLLDEGAYLETTMRKLKLYNENGIVLGDNLLITCETSRNPLNVKMLDSMLRTCIGQDF